MIMIGRQYNIEQLKEQLENLKTQGLIYEYRFVKNKGKYGLILHTVHKDVEKLNYYRIRINENIIVLHLPNKIEYISIYYDLEDLTNKLIFD